MAVEKKRARRIRVENLEGKIDVGMLWWERRSCGETNECRDGRWREIGREKGIIKEK